jgi:hypothetical protein
LCLYRDTFELSVDAGATEHRCFAVLLEVGDELAQLQGIGAVQVVDEDVLELEITFELALVGVGAAPEHSDDHGDLLDPALDFIEILVAHAALAGGLVQADFDIARAAVVLVGPVAFDELGLILALDRRRFDERDQILAILASDDV